MRPPALLIVGCLLVACAGPTRTSSPWGPPDLPAQARELTMVRGDDGTPVAWQELVERAAAADVVLVGETHGLRHGLAAAAFLFEDLLADPDLSPALALEFFERDDQVHLDDLAAGVTDQAGLIAALRLSPGNFPPGHRAMVAAAVEAGRPVWAANAPRRYVTLARTRGYGFLRGLGPEQARLMRVPWTLTEGDYRARFAELMPGHPGSRDATMLAVFRSQNLWDATMADTVVRASLRDGAPVVLVVGRFHVEYEGGLLQRLRDQAPHLEVLTLAVLDERSDDLRPEDEGRADVVIYAASPEED